AQLRRDLVALAQDQAAAEREVTAEHAMEARGVDERVSERAREHLPAHARGALRVELDIAHRRDGGIDERARARIVRIVCAIVRGWTMRGDGAERGDGDEGGDSHGNPGGVQPLPSMSMKIGFAKPSGHARGTTRVTRNSGSLASVGSGGASSGPVSSPSS